MVGQAQTSRRTSNQTSSRERPGARGPHTLIWLPIPVVLLAVALLTYLRLETVANSPLLIPTLNILFLSLIPLLVSGLAAKSFLDGQPGPVLFLGGGTLALALGAVLAVSPLLGPDPNSMVSVYNTAAWMAGFCHLVSALASTSPGPRRLRSGWLSLLTVYAGIPILILLLVLLVRVHLWPVYFVEGSGATAAGFGVLWTSAALFAISAAVMGARPDLGKSDFGRWYTLGLALIAAGLLGVSLQASIGDPLNWVGRISQYLGSVYMLVAVVSSIRQRGSWTLPLEQALRESEEALRRSEQHYRSLFETMLQGVVYQDADGTILSMNPAAEQILGKTHQEFMGETSVSVEHHTLREDGTPFPGLEHPAMVALQTGQEMRDVVMGVFNPREQGYRWISISAVPLFRGDEEKPYQVYTLFSDITERRQAQAALAKSERSLAEAQRIARIGSWEWNVQTGEVRWSAELYSIYGVDPDSFIPTIGSFADYIHPEDRESVNRVMGQVISGGASVSFDFRIIAEDGSVHYLSVTGEATEFDETGIPLVVMGTNQDITERERARERIRLQHGVLEGINRVFLEALSGSTEEGLGRACLAVAEEVTASKFGFIGEINAEGLEEIAISDPGWDACRVERPEDCGKVPLSFAIHGIYGRVLLDGKGLFTNDPASHPDSLGLPQGHPPLSAFLGVPLIHEGKTLGMVGVGNREGGYRNEDLESLEALAPAMVQVFLRKRAEEDREKSLVSEREARAEAEAAVKVRDEFLSIAAHELKTPVTSLQGFAQVMLRELGRIGTVDPGRLSKAMERIEQQSKRLARLTEGLLDLSRLQAGKVVLCLEETDLSKLVRDSVSTFQHSSLGRPVEIHNGDVIPVFVNPSRMEQVLTNLLDNAAKFSPPDSKIEIDMRASHPGWVEIAVRDHGIGVPAGHEERIFERFHQAHPDRYAGGMGIGLFVSREIVEMHGGTIAAERPEDGGSRFVVRLPSKRQDG